MERDRPFCPEHGSPTFTHCKVCREAWDVIGGQIIFLERGATFCGTCAAPAPWATVQERIEWIRDRLTEVTLDPRDEIQLREGLTLLAESPNRQHPGDMAVWTLLKAKAPDVWTLAKPVLTSVLSDEIKRRLGL